MYDTLVQIGLGAYPLGMAERRMNAISVTLDAETNDRLGKEAADLNLTKSALIRLMLRKCWASLGGLTL